MRGFIPHKWLSEAWEEIHEAKIVEIHQLKGKKSEKDIAYYVVGNYVSKQPISRLSYSQKWVCKGFSKNWEVFIELYGKRAIDLWDKWLILTEFKYYRDSKLFNPQDSVKLDFKL